MIQYTKLSLNLKINHLSSKKILFAIVDQAKVKSKNENLFKKVYDMTLYYTRKIVSSFLIGDICYFDNIDQAMSYDKNTYDYIIIQSVGNYIKHNIFFEYLDNYCQINPDFFMISFTLDWDAEKGEGWVECHHQMMVVNLNTWKKIGSPIFGGWDVVTEDLPNYSRSIENFHDRYTPYWIKGEEGVVNKTRSKQGWGFIKAALLNGIKIDNFSKEMRNCRLYVYPETDSDLLYEAFLTNNVDLIKNPNQKKWIKTLNSDPVIWIFNSEEYNFKFKKVKRLKNCNFYFGPAAGFKYLDMLNYNKNVKFIFYDYNQDSLDWINTLRNEWDGEDIINFIENRPSEIRKKYKFINDNLENNYKLLLKDFINKDNFKVLWKRFKEAEVEFHRVDLLDNESVFNLLNQYKDESVFFYYSNIFSVDLLIKNYSIEELNEIYDNFLKLIRKIIPNSIIYGTDTTGIWIHEHNN